LIFNGSVLVSDTLFACVKQSTPNAERRTPNADEFQKNIPKQELEIAVRIEIET